MKKIILSVVIIFIIESAKLVAQCTPDVNNMANYNPDCDAGFPHDTVGKAYSTVLQVKAPTDTVYTGLSVRIDSIKLTGISGLPPGFTYSTTPASGTLPGGTRGCMQITGPAPLATGTYSLTINVLGWGTITGTSTQIGPVPISVTCYTIQIDAPAGVNNLSGGGHFTLSQNRPDPASKSTDIFYNLPTASRLEFKVFNLLGRLVYEKSFFGEPGTGRITLDAKDFPPGIYMYNLSNGKSMLTRRMVMAYN